MRSSKGVARPERCNSCSFHLLLAHGRVNDPMAKLQFLRVGWGGVGWGGDDDILWSWTHAGCSQLCLFVIAHMLDATQLCLSCHCTHAGCYASVFVLSLHTCWMLRICVCLVIAHMLDATQLCLFVIAHMLDATQLCLSCHCTHAGCYASVFVL